MQHPVGWYQRLPFLMPEHRSDHWWTVRPDDETSAVAGEVVRAIREHALREMRRRATT